jgi:hypothetical protein
MKYPAFTDLRIRGLYINRLFSLESDFLMPPQWWPISRSTNFFFFVIGPMRLAIVFGARYSQSLTRHTDSQRTLERIVIGTTTYVKVVRKAWA